jgi:hypothetical protein
MLLPLLARALSRCAGARIAAQLGHLHPLDHLAHGRERDADIPVGHVRVGVASDRPSVIEPAWYNRVYTKTREGGQAMRKRDE